MLLALRPAYTENPQIILSETLQPAPSFAGASLGTVDDSYSPTAVTSQNFQKIIPTTPASLGDGDTNTGQGSGNITGPLAGTSRLGATAVADITAISGTISYLRAFAWVYLSDTALGGYVIKAPSNPKIYVKVGAQETAWTVLDTSAQTIGTLRLYQSADMTLAPDGVAWTIDKINALIEAGFEFAYNLTPTEMFNWELRELWIDAYGPQGAVVLPIKKTLSVIDIRATQPLKTFTQTGATGFDIVKKLVVKPTIE